MEHDNLLELDKVDLDLDLHISLNLKYPQLNLIQKLLRNRFFFVPLKYELDESSSPINIKVSKSKHHSRHYYHGVSFKKIEKTEFVNEAISVLKKFDGFKHHKENGHVIHKTFFKDVFFSYHTEYFEKNSLLELKPQRPIQNDSSSYRFKKIIKCEDGADGVINLLCLVEVDGSISKIEVIQRSGKISSEEAVEDFKSLGRFTPASKDNKPVQSQISILVYR